MVQIKLILEEEIIIDLFLSKNKEFTRVLLERAINCILNAEAEDALGLVRYERSDERKTYRNGYRSRSLKTRAGKLALQIPKLRNGNFSTQLMKRYKTMESTAIVELIRLAVLGVTTENTRKYVKLLCGKEFSDQVMEILCQELEQVAKEFVDSCQGSDVDMFLADGATLRLHDAPDSAAYSLRLAVEENENGVKEIVGFGSPNRLTKET